MINCLIYALFNFSCIQCIKRFYNTSHIRNAYGIVTGPVNVEEGYAIPVSMDLPPYGETGVVPPSFERLKPKTEEELVHMRLTNETARKVLWAVKTKVKVSLLSD